MRPFLRGSFSGDIDQEAPHRFCGARDELLPVLPSIRQAAMLAKHEVRFVYQFRGRVLAAFTGIHLTRSDPAQIFVDPLEQLVLRLLISGAHPVD
jgi:hypothetical protein